MTVALRALVACSLALTTAGIAFPASAVVAADEACAPGTYDYSTEQPPALDLLQADIAWERATGAGVLVAVVDSGVDAANAHLSGAVVGGIDLVGDGTNPDGTSDVNGHGTAIAGQIAARSIPESGVVGLAPDANLLSVRVYRSDDDQSVKAGFGPSPDRLAAGIRYAADSGAQIINADVPLLSADVVGLDRPDIDRRRHVLQGADGAADFCVLTGGDAVQNSRGQAVPAFLLLRCHPAVAQSGIGVRDDCENIAEVCARLHVGGGPLGCRHRRGGGLGTSAAPRQCQRTDHDKRRKDDVPTTHACLPKAHRYSTQ